MKKYFLVAVTLLLVALVGTVGLLVMRTMRQRPEDLMKLTLDMAPGVAQQIHDFRRVKMQDGRMVWEVAAREAQVYDDNQSIEVRGITLRWYLSDGRVVGLKGERGTVRLDGREIKRIELADDVIVSLADYEVRVASASYDHDAQTIVAPGRVEVSGKSLHLRGTGMTVDVKAQRLALLQEVSMDFDPNGLGGVAHVPS